MADPEGTGRGLHRPSLDDFIFEGEATPLLFRKRVIFGIAGGLAALIAAYVVTSSLLGWTTEINAGPLREWVEDFGPWAPALFVLIMAFSVLVAPIPNAPIFAAAGLVWGSVLGTVYSLAGLLLGSAMAFCVARWTGRRYVGRLIGAKAAGRLDRAAETMGGRVIFWSRMMPGINFDWISFVAGMTSIRFAVFFAYSALGMILPTAVTVVAGDGLGKDFRLTIAAGAVYVLGLALSGLFFWHRRRRWQQARGRR
ncbi:MAG: TVP38/TMEM64 family protein [Dehalococcoidia bacterium]